MCQVFAGLPPSSYEPETRSIRIQGHATSLRLERAFWRVLEEIAAHQGVSVSRFINKLHSEVLQHRGDCANFASLLRCTCLTYVGEIQGRSAPERALQTAAATDFSGPGGSSAARLQVLV